MHSSNEVRHSLATSATVGIGELKVVRLRSSLAMITELQKRKRYDFGVSCNTIATWSGYLIYHN